VVENSPAKNAEVEKKEKDVVVEFDPDMEKVRSFDSEGGCCDWPKDRVHFIALAFNCWLLDWKEW